MTRRRLASAPLFLALVLSTLSLAPAAAQDARPVPAERSAGEVLDDLAPALRSEIPAVREGAETKLFALGEPGRAALQEWARGSDPALSSLALRLLSRDEWRPKTTRPAAPLAGERSVEQQLEEMNRDLEARFRDLRERMRNSLRDRVDLSDLRDGLTSGATQSGKVVENGSEFTWSRDADGKIEVTLKDGPDAETRRYTFDSLEAARKSEPDVAKRLDEVLGRVHTPRIRFRFGNDWTEIPRLDVTPPDLDRLRRGLRDWIDPDPRDDGEQRDGARTPGDTPSARPLFGIRFEPPTELLRTHLELGDTGLVVMHVEPGTHAAQLGLTRLDILTHVCGKPVAAATDIWSALETRDATKPLTATVVRRGKRVDLTTGSK